MMRRMSSYAEVDDVIAAWVKAIGSTLHTQWAGAPARYFHVPGDPPFECFQVSVRPPENGRVAVTARAIDTNDNTEEDMDQTWEGPLANLDEMLGNALAIVEKWKTRERTKPDPPSPWTAEEVRKWEHSRLGEIAIYTAAISFGMYVVFGGLITRVVGISEVAGQGFLLLLVTICAFVVLSPLGRKPSRNDDQ